MPAIAGDKMAAAVFSAPTGAVVGPIQSDFGWVVAKVDSVKTEGGKSLAQAHAEIAAKLNTDKRKQAIEDVVDKVQNALDEGNNFAEAAAAAKIPVTHHAADHRGRSVARRSGVQVARRARARAQDRVRDRRQRPARNRLAAERPGLCDRLARRRSSPAAPAPLASIRDRVASDWINTRRRSARKAVGRARSPPRRRAGFRSRRR